MYDYNATITNVVDGDTYDADIDLGFHIHIHERVRVLDLNTPEKKGQEKELGNICKEYAEKLLLGKSIILYSKKEVKSPQTDSFGRWLCYVVFPDGSDITGIFTSLGCNKYADNYSEESVYKLRDSLKEGT